MSGERRAKEGGDMAGEGRRIGRPEAAAFAKRAKKWGSKRLGVGDSEMDFDGHNQA
jgi:hypothetical protein